MTRINSGLLTDTLNLVQLARETALAKGKQEQAQRLNPVVEELKTLATSSRPAAQPAAPSGTMAQNDFRTLLNVANQTPAQSFQAAPAVGGSDRNRMILAMSSADMKEIDIARQMGITLDEVRMVVTANQKGRSGVEVKK